MRILLGEDHIQDMALAAISDGGRARSFLFMVFEEWPDR